MAYAITLRLDATAAVLIEAMWQTLASRGVSREALDLGWKGDALLGEHYKPYAPPLTGQYFNQRKTTIYAGSTEIQKNIISQMILGL